MSNSHPDEQSGLLDYAAASQLLGIPRGTLSRWVLEGRIPHIRLGDRTVRFEREELVGWYRGHRQPARGPRTMQAAGYCTASAGNGRGGEPR